MLFRSSSSSSSSSAPGSAPRPARPPRARLPPSMDGKAAPNGVATIEDRILRITGYYGYYPGYSTQKSKAPTAPLPPWWASPRQVPSGGWRGGGRNGHPAAALGRGAGIWSFLGAFFSVPSQLSAAPGKFGWRWGPSEPQHPPMVPFPRQSNQIFPERWGVIGRSGFASR